MSFLHQIGAEALDGVFWRPLEHIEEVLIGIVDRSLKTTGIQILIVGAVNFAILLLNVEWIQFLLVTFLLTVVPPDLEVLLVHSIDVTDFFICYSHFFLHCMVLRTDLLMSRPNLVMLRANLAMP